MIERFIDTHAAIEGRDAIVTGADIGARAKERAAELRGQCPAGRPVGVSLDQGIENCITDLALLEAGLPALPLPAFFTDTQRGHALAAAGAVTVITADGLERLDFPAAVLPEGTAKISFTSGSNGTPKGICLSAGHLMAVARSVVDAVGRDHAGRHLALLPPGILLENVAGFYATLIAGGTYVALPQADVGLGNPFRPDFLAMVRVIAERRITSLILVPEYLAGIVAVLEATGTGLPLLTLVAVGGARVPSALMARADRLGLPVRQGYGMTECGSVVALEDGRETERGSVGRSLGLSQIEIADDGEIILHGPGYLGTIGAPRATAPIDTGDIGRIDDTGRLWIEGRKSNLIITSHGRNIAPEWVESLLLGQSGIMQAMIHGDGDASLSALIVSAATDHEIEAALATTNAKLPAYAHVTSWRRVAPFTPGNGLLTGNGRLRRDAIMQKYGKGEDGLTFFERLQAATTAAQMRFLQVPQLQAGLAGNISRDTYIAYLTQAYHHVRHTVPLLQEALSQLGHRRDLADALADYIEEETGHEQWILNDIAAAGGDADAAAASTPNPETQAMVDHAYEVIRTGNPIGFFGMVYVLEGTSVAMATQGAGAVAQRLGLPPQAFTYLTSHGALDQSHMKGLETTLNGLTDPADQQAVIDMANAMFGLFGGMFASIPMEEEAHVEA